MKRILYAVMLLLGMSIVASCEKEKGKENENENEYVLVGCNVSYENLEFVSEEPMTKATEPNAIYAIQVREYDSDIFTAHSYCYGFYDDISSLEIRFKKNHKYLIHMDYFPNGKNELVYNGLDYGSPIERVPRNLNTPIEFNKIVYDTNHELGTIGSAAIATNEYGAIQYYLPINRYMYINSAFIPKDNTPLSVLFLRMNAGLTIKLEKVEGFDFDTVQLYESDFSPTYEADVKNGETEIKVPLIALWGEWDCIPELRTIQYKIGTKENPALFYQGDIELKRNTMRTYTIKLETDETVNPMSISYENSEYSQDDGGYLN
jgi:hypothetical protein